MWREDRFANHFFLLPKESTGLPVTALEPIDQNRWCKSVCPPRFPVGNPLLVECQVFSESPKTQTSSPVRASNANALSAALTP